MGVTINTLAKHVEVDGAVIHLTPREWETVSNLADGGTRHLTEYDRWHVKNLRRKGIPIKNNRGHGYSLQGSIKIIGTVPKMTLESAKRGCAGHCLCDGKVIYCGS